MPDEAIITHINELIAEEHQLRSHAIGQGLTPTQQARLADLESRLDQYWDLLRQRRARAEFGANPNEAHPRPTSEADSYRQ